MHSDWIDRIIEGPEGRDLKKKIEHPKIFISYAWGDEEYQNQVLSFASQLVSDGVDVVFDKWDLTEGNDTYAFMEKCASDPSITNVLMLLDPIYAEKADNHSGGVGTETQIISAKVYQEGTQDKFIPVIMKRNENGAVCKPTYLQGRLHFDLSDPEVYDTTYHRLVKTLFGEEIYVKPTLGKKPDWVDKPISAAPKSFVTYDSLKTLQSTKAKTASYVGYLSDISSKLITFAQDKQSGSIKNNEYIALYDSPKEIVLEFLLLLKNSYYVDDSHKRIAGFFEETENAISQLNTLPSEVIIIRIHEMFLYTIAFFMKNKDYTAIGYLLGKTYFNKNRYIAGSNADGFNMFNSGTNQENLDNAIRARDNKKYYTGTGLHWIETLSDSFCSKEQFILADLICFNYSIYGKYFLSSWHWFPVTYIYDNEYNSALTLIGKKLISREFVQEILPLFGFESIDEFIQKVKSVEGAPSGTYQDYRYPETFVSAHMLGDFIKSEEIASLR